MPLNACEHPVLVVWKASACMTPLTGSVGVAVRSYGPHMNDIVPCQPAPVQRKVPVPLGAVAVASHRAQSDVTVRTSGPASDR